MKADQFEAMPTLEDLSSIEAEQGVLGCLLMDNSAFDRVSDILRPDHFFHDLHRAIYVEVSRQLSAGKSADVITIYEANPDLGLSYLNELAGYVRAVSAARRYADLIIERAKSRQLLQISAEVVEQAKAHGTPIAERVESVQAMLGVLTNDDTPKDDWVGAAEGLLAHTAIIERRAGGLEKAMPTGLNDLDDKLDGGLRPGMLVTIGARPSMGKTALAMTIGVNMAEQQSVGFFSMEMPKSELNDRLVAMLGEVSLKSVKRPSRGDGLNWSAVMDGCEKARSLRLHVSDQSGLNINQVRIKARTLKRRRGLDVLIVDYLGLMTGLDPKMMRTYQLEEVTRGLKSLAKELDVAVILLAQLNRGAEETPMQVEKLSDFRDSGGVEQDSDVCMFIRRPIQMKPDLGQEFTHYARLNIAKNRNGECGLVHLNYLGEQTKFRPWYGQVPEIGRGNTNTGAKQAL